MGLALRNIPRNPVGGLTPRPRRSLVLNIQREIINAYIRAGAYAPIHGLAITPSRPQRPGPWRSSPTRLRGTFRLGFAGMYPATYPLCVRGPPGFALRCVGCWLAALCRRFLQHPLPDLSRHGQRRRRNPIFHFPTFSLHFLFAKKHKKYENQQKMIPNRLLLFCSYSRSIMLLPGSDA